MPEKLEARLTLYNLIVHPISTIGLKEKKHSNLPAFAEIGQAVDNLNKKII